MPPQRQCGAHAACAEAAPRCGVRSEPSRDARPRRPRPFLSRQRSLYRRSLPIGRLSRSRGSQRPIRLSSFRTLPFRCLAALRNGGVQGTAAAVAQPVLVLADGVRCAAATPRLALPAHSGLLHGEEQSGQAAAPGVFPPAGAHGVLDRGEAAALRAAAAAQVHGLPADLCPQRGPLVPELHQDRLCAGAAPESRPADSRESPGGGGAGGRESPGGLGGSGTRGSRSAGTRNGGESPAVRGGSGSVPGYGRAALPCLRRSPAGELLPEQKAAVALPRAGSHARPVPDTACFHPHRLPLRPQPAAGSLHTWFGTGVGGREKWELLGGGAGL